MAYRTKGGRRFPVARGATNTRMRMVALDGTRATFECKAGHRSSIDYGKGPVSRRMSAQALQRFRKYWGLDEPGPGEARGHCSGWCQKCQNEIDGVAEPKRWEPEDCQALWAITEAKPPDHNGGWFHRFGCILLKVTKRPVTCAACGEVIKADTEVLYGDELKDHELWAPRRRHLHRQPCIPVKGAK